MHLLKLLPRFRAMNTKLDELSTREQWSRSEIQAFQLERINRLWNTAIHQVPFYTQLAQTLRLPARFGSLAEYSHLVPSLDKQQVRSRRDEFVARPRPIGKWHRTGGSTGIPTEVYWSHTAHLEMLRGKYRSEQIYGIDVFDRKAFFWGHEGSIPQGWNGRLQRGLRPIEDRLRNRLRISAYQLSDSDLTRHLSLIDRFQPKCLYGYSSAIELLATHADRLNMDISSLKLCVLTAEPADSHMRSAVANHLSCNVAIEYGSAECGLIAYSMPDGSIRTRDDHVFVETIKNADGHDEIIVTVLGNAAFPLMRYRIEDTTSRPIRIPEQGFSILHDVQAGAMTPS